MSVTLLACAYVLVAALLLNLWISTSWSLAVKITAVFLVTVLYVGSYLGLREIQGWPTRQALPDRFRLLWAKIEEPDKASSSEGQIYLWVRGLDDTQRAAGEPRAYRLPWSLALAEKIAAALERTEAGEALNGRMTRQPVKETEEPSRADPKMPDEGNSLPTGLDEGPLQLEFDELPRVQLPAKGA